MLPSQISEYLTGRDLDPAYLVAWYLFKMLKIACFTH